MHAVSQYQSLISEYLNSLNKKKEPQSLYEPVHYILSLGGKRLRPVLALIGAELFGCDCNKAMNAALSVEMFHNFSLVHDDIMDAAPLRRGKQTVHEKWNVNAGILSGDAMLIMAYQLFEEYEPAIFQSLAKLFSKTALEVCEGQQYDMDFAERDDVTIDNYLKMIEYKTAVLVGAAMQMGAIVANASSDDQQRIYNFGKNLGIAFQIQDDYLDAFGDPKTFGKQVGGDIIENKKTFLYLKTLELSNPQDQLQLEHLYSISPADSTQKIDTVKQLFLTSGAAEATKTEIENYTNKAFAVLDALAIADSKKDMLVQFGKDLMKRNV